jgi:parvulin-like peptidyl-prolyl isomerase
LKAPPVAPHPHAVCLTLLGVLACAQAPSADPELLRLGAHAVTRSDFERHLEGIEARGGAVDAEVREALLEAFVEERALVLEARARDLLQPGATPEEERAAVQRLLGAEVLDRLRIGEAEIAAYFEAHAEELRLPETLTLSQILLLTENEARDVLRRLARDPKSFERLARTRSRGPEAEQGGHMGSFNPGELPAELEAAAFSVRVGGTSGVLQSPFGFHVLKVEARQPARERSLEECRGEIHESLLRERSEQAVRRYVRDLLARAKVNYEAARSPRRRS